MLKSMIQTPSQALNEMNNFLQKHIGKTDPMWKLFNNDYEIKDKCSAHRLMQAKQELNNFVNQPNTIDNCKTSANGIWGALEILYNNDINEEDGWLTFDIDYSNAYAVMRAISYYRLDRTFEVITNRIAIKTNDIGGNLKLWAPPKPEYVNQMLNEINELRHIGNWVKDTNNLIK